MASVTALCAARSFVAMGPETAFTSSCCTRSEEHTSELQSLAYIVCRLLLEKKKIASRAASSRPSPGWAPFWVIGMDLEVVLGSGCPPPTHASGHTVATPRRHAFFLTKWASTPCPGHRERGPGSHQGASHDRIACTDLRHGCELAAAAAPHALAQASRAR